MKIRNGFVSNSSSSSFIIKHKPASLFCHEEPKRLLKDSEIKKLKKYGFEYDGSNYTFEVICNQDDVIEFLLKEKIPFEAECHYGLYQVFYYPKDDLVIEAYNYGCEIALYGPDMTIDSYFDKNSPDEFRQGIKKFTRLGYLSAL